MVNYWLFQIMNDQFPTLWEECVRRGIAAQHYPRGWTNEAPNVERFQRMKRGDKIIAALKEHRFAGYGTLKSNFYRSGPPLQIENGFGEVHGFLERLDCDWTVIPLSRRQQFLKCDDLKAAGFHIDLERGRAVRQIDKRTYDALTARLDLGGARKHLNVWVVKARKTLKDGATGWHWSKYFDLWDGRGKRLAWGGPDWIHSSYSKKLIREQVHQGDLVVAYQMDDVVYGRAILGFSTMASDGKEMSGEYNAFDIASPAESFALEEPVRIKDLYRIGCRPKCFGLGTQGTLFPISPSEFDAVVSAIVSLSADKHGLRDWLRRVGSPVAFETTTLVPNANPWDDEPVVGNYEELVANAERQCANRDYRAVERLIKQWIRHDHRLIRALKAKYKYRCQFPSCGVSISALNGEPYCEVAHIRAVARGGKARRLNLLVLCPNHHKMIDYGDLKIEVNTQKVLKGTLNGKTFTIRR